MEEEVKGYDMESMPMQEAKEMLRFQIDFDAIFKLPKEERDFYLEIIERGANSYDIGEMIQEYLAKYDNDIFKIENKDIKDYFIANNKILPTYIIVDMMKSKGLVIDHREANINEALN